ncbi:MAG: CRISPR-associated protein Cas4 [Chloroflexi bacterium]|nr:CRISPR-associated protein Cas4 [Chloroflexota bacterium]
MYDEDELLPISGLQHLLFCERRAALVHVEGLWDDNVFTVEGTILHDRAHDLGTEVRSDLRIARGLRLRSLALGLSGMADVVEFHLLARGEGAVGVSLEGVAGLWRPVPVEYKRGKLRREEGYVIQLCAQALCLEEMLSTSVRRGAVFYGKTRRRLEIDFDGKLREATKDAAAGLHRLIESGVTPAARRGPKCERCSLLEKCLPALQSKRRSVSRYLATAISAAEGDALERGVA